MSINHASYRNYNVVLVVRSVSSLNRRTVEQSGLKRMPGLTLVQIEREGNIISDPNGDLVILSKDHLYFTGVIDAVLALTQLDGLTLSEDEVFPFFISILFSTLHLLTVEM